MHIQGLLKQVNKISRVMDVCTDSFTIRQKYLEHAVSSIYHLILACDADRICQMLADGRREQKDPAAHF